MIHVLTFLASVGAGVIAGKIYCLLADLVRRAELREMGRDYDRTMAAWTEEAPR